MHVNGETKPAFASIEETIDAFRRGEFIIVLDSTERENEGDLIIAAEDVTTEQMAFMIRYTSGLICTPMPSTLTQSLNLPQMVTDNTESHRTAYTISVDAASPSVSTGISAHDRALTCRTLASATATPDSFRRPGHVFPLRARDGGVRERRGHTEAAVEFCRLAGKKSHVAAICELIIDGQHNPSPESTGTSNKAELSGSGMQRRDECLAFGRQWGLKVCTIEDLVDYVQLHHTNLQNNKA